MKKRAFLAAFPYTIPIGTGFLALGFAYGIYMSSFGFSFIYPMLMSMLIFAGSMEILSVSLLLSPYNPIYVFFLTLMVNARHLFYGISLLDKYRNTGAKKLYLIFGLCDESFSLNYSITPQDDIDKGWFMFFITLLNQVYWVFSSTLGGILGSYINFNSKGVEFALPALFIVIFLDQWLNTTNHIPAIIGVVSTLVSLIVLGPSNFMIPAMILIILNLTILKSSMEKGEIL